MAVGSQGFIGFVALDGTVYMGVVCKNGSGVPTSPDAAPSYRIYDEDRTSTLHTGTLSGSDTDSQTGFRTGSQASITTANGYARGKTYYILIGYAISSTNYADELLFTVV